MGNPCQDETTLSAFLDGELSEINALKIRQHLKQCEVCRQHLADLGTADRLVQGLDRVTPSADFDRAFWAKVDALEQRRTNRWWTHWSTHWSNRLTRPVWQPALAAGLAAGLVIAAFTFTRPEPGVTLEDRFIAENMEFFKNYDLIHNIEILENWDAVEAMKDLS